MLLLTSGSIDSSADRPLRVAGRDAGSGIDYVLLPEYGRRISGTPNPHEPAPRLTAQCTRRPNGSLRFELLADAGTTVPPSYYPPWHQTKDDLYPPNLEKVAVTMEFLGYTKVKPVKRQWVRLQEQPEELRYNTPGADSSNLEEIAFYLQYLRALPTLRLTIPGQAAIEFDTAGWLARVKAEPLCHASGL